ncbi:hypothetical protein HOD20_10320 [archaeon]|jgi:hypothetical protein|nr:hypothetical protein [archaeon]MBT4352904.1 hypothetical protein [archaeon]MBT4648460.1 hypothetical protein [archaeon]MBT6821731.1 hypothetical protein [archaeon]MBT7391394.1 hypothetical protein [archaeon]
MKYLLRLILVVGLMSFLATPVIAGDICQGDILCYLSFGAIGYLPFFLIFIVITFIVIKFISPSLSLKKKVMFSILLSLIIIVFHYSFLSIWIEKTQIANNDKKQLSQMDYKFLVPNYIPDGYYVTQARVSDYLYFIYGGKHGNFILSEFKKPSRIFLNPTYCIISGKSTESFEFRDEFSSMMMTGIQDDCWEIKTPKGNSIYLMDYQATQSSPKRNYAVTVIDDTLITITSYSFSNEELIKLIDGLEEEEPDKIKIKVSSRTIGR